MGGGLNVGPSTGSDLQAVDGTGLFAGPMEEGVGFIDTSALQTGPVGTGFANAYPNPASRARFLAGLKLNGPRRRRQ